MSDKKMTDAEIAAYNSAVELAIVVCKDIASTHNNLTSNNKNVFDILLKSIEELKIVKSDKDIIKELEAKIKSLEELIGKDFDIDKEHFELKVIPGVVKPNTFQKIYRSNIRKGIPHACGCIGPQNGDPLCPCMMRNKGI